MKKYHTFRYALSRMKQIIFQKKNPNVPWLTPSSISLLEQLIKKTDVGFEFGSGRSTKWFATRCQYLYSVEHNQKWFEIVQNQIKDYDNIEYYWKTIN